MTSNIDGSFQGLQSRDIPELERQYGRNILKPKKGAFLKLPLEIITEPMFLLLAIACLTYLLLGRLREGIMTIIALFFVAAISVFQSIRSSKALKALQNLSEPALTVIRDGGRQVILSTHLLPGDIMVLGEGDRIPADAVVLKSNDLSVNESVITGESLAVEKNSNSPLFQGCILQTGQCYAQVTAIGNLTELGKIGKSIEQYKAPKTHLQQSIAKIVKRLAIIGLFAFVIIWVFNYIKSGDILNSLLAGLTLIMAAIPEEIPVAFSSFMALGAFRMSKLGIISRHPVVIENLGAVSVICLDKTGTITENKMVVDSVYDHKTKNTKLPCECDVLKYAALASEKDPFDEMERAILRSYAPYQKDTIPEITFEYPLDNHPPMMTHVYGVSGEYIIAAKGAPERILQVCKLEANERKSLHEHVHAMASKGYRVLGVAGCRHSKALPKTQDEFEWEFIGLIHLFDPPKKDIEQVFRQFKSAGIEIKLLTGDYSQTAINIARQVGMELKGTYVEGHTIMAQSEEELSETVKNNSIFTRMFPEAKLKVIECLKKNGEIVAMTGDGVNDGPALKASNIGIAMGRKGTQTARQASDIILTDDNLNKVTEAIRQGRKIFNNLSKAIRYIISIHIPIILIASMPLLLNWKYPNIFTPIHVIFLELIMGPTCSIFFENEPEQKDSMLIPPRKRHLGLFNNAQVLLSITQGLVITAAILILDFYFSQAHTLGEVRAAVFTALLSSNIFLTFTNRSFTESIVHTIRYKNPLAYLIITLSFFFIAIIHLIPPIRSLFEMDPLSEKELALCLFAGMVSVLWLEIVKVIRRKPVVGNV